MASAAASQPIISPIKRSGDSDHRRHIVSAGTTATMSAGGAPSGHQSQDGFKPGTADSRATQGSLADNRGVYVPPLSSGGIGANDGAQRGRTGSSARLDGGPSLPGSIYMDADQMGDDFDLADVSGRSPASSSRKGIGMGSSPMLGHSQSAASFEHRPGTTPHGRSSRGARSHRSTTSSRSRRSRSRGGLRGSRSMASLGGYEPPTSTRMLKKSQLEVAKELAQDYPSLQARMKDPMFQEAAAQVGVDLNDLHPRDPSAFRRTMATPRSSLRSRAQFFEQTRIEQVALVVMQMRVAEEEREEVERKKRRMRKLLAKDLLGRVEREKARIERMETERLRRQRIIDMEENKMKRDENQEQAIQEAEQRAEERRLRHAAKKRKEAEARGREKTKQIIAARKRRERREAERLTQIQRTEERRAAQQAKALARLQERKDQMKRRMKAKERLLTERMGDAVEGELDRRDHARKAMERAEEQRKKIEQARLEELQRKRDERWVAEQRAHMNSMRLRRQAQYRSKKKGSGAMHALEKASLLHEVSLSIEKERQVKRKRTLIETDKWKSKRNVIPERQQTPGPGTYVVPSELTQSKGFSWRKPMPEKVKKALTEKSWVDEMPAPGHYGVPKDDLLRPNPARSTKFNMSKPKTEDEWLSLRAKQLPAPHDYGHGDRRPTTAPTPGGQFEQGRFSPHKGMSFLDHAIKMGPGRDAPGPGGFLMEDVVREQDTVPRARQVPGSTMSLASFVQPGGSRGAQSARGRSMTAASFNGGASVGGMSLPLGVGRPRTDSAPEQFGAGALQAGGDFKMKIMPLGNMKGAKNFSMTTGRLAGGLQGARNADGSVIDPFRASAKKLFGGSRRAKAAAASSAAAQMPGRVGATRPDMKFVPGLTQVSATLSEVLNESDEEGELGSHDGADAVPTDVDASGSFVPAAGQVPLSPVVTDSVVDASGAKAKSFGLDCEDDEGAAPVPQPKGDLTAAATNQGSGGSDVTGSTDKSGNNSGNNSGNKSQGGDATAAAVVDRASIASPAGDSIPEAEEEDDDEVEG